MAAELFDGVGATDAITGRATEGLWPWRGPTDDEDGVPNGGTLCHPVELPAGVESGPDGRFDTGTGCDNRGKGLEVDGGPRGMAWLTRNGREAETLVD